MKIAVLANQLLKEEIEQKPVGEDAGFIWAASFDELIAVTGANAYFDLEFVNDNKRIEHLTKLLPKPVFINSVVRTLSQIKQPFIRINAWAGLLKRNICEVSGSDDGQRKSAENIFHQLKWDYQFVPDVPGMVSARIIAMIINEAYYTLQDEVSTKAEIDIAMKLGTNYPYGPFEWSEKIGLKNIYDLLIELSKTDSIYKVSEALEKELIVVSGNQ
jgi:3-hydroxybutyryl-CoA dehydrogenase